jgi:hypothetical protein
MGQNWPLRTKFKTLHYIFHVALGGKIRVTPHKIGANKAIGGVFSLAMLTASFSLL